MEVTVVPIDSYVVRDFLMLSCFLMLSSSCFVVILLFPVDRCPIRLYLRSSNESTSSPDVKSVFMISSSKCDINLLRIVQSIIAINTNAIYLLLVWVIRESRITQCSRWHKLSITHNSVAGAEVLRTAYLVNTDLKLNSHLERYSLLYTHVFEHTKLMVGSTICQPLSSYFTALNLDTKWYIRYRPRKGSYGSPVYLAGSRRSWPSLHESAIVTNSRTLRSNG